MPLTVLNMRPTYHSIDVEDFQGARDTEGAIFRRTLADLQTKTYTRSILLFRTAITQRRHPRHGGGGGQGGGTAQNFTCSTPGDESVWVT